MLHLDYTNDIIMDAEKQNLRWKKISSMWKTTDKKCIETVGH